MVQAIRLAMGCFTSAFARPVRRYVLKIFQDDLAQSNSGGLPYRSALPWVNGEYYRNHPSPRLIFVPARSLAHGDSPHPFENTAHFCPSYLFLLSSSSSARLLKPTTWYASSHPALSVFLPATTIGFPAPHFPFLQAELARDFALWKP